MAEKVTISIENHQILIDAECDRDYHGRGRIVFDEISKEKSYVAYYEEFIEDVYDDQGNLLAKKGEIYSDQTMTWDQFKILQPMAKPYKIPSQISNLD
ncbi:MAG: hypothetical protein KJN62_08735 [Deltaproteobacteria bacterium]|nr:hypothetical protein [Deltaproteobacteria bacterium]